MTCGDLQVRVDISVSPLEDDAAAAAANETPPSYQFTLDNGRLTEEQRRHYEQNGFVVVKKLVPDELLDQFR